MGVRVIPERRFYVCDRCGFEHENQLARNSHATVTIDATSRMFGGDVGGGTTKQWLCGKCENDLRQFLAGKAIKPLVEEVVAQPE